MQVGVAKYVNSVSKPGMTTGATTGRHTDRHVWTVTTIGMTTGLQTGRHTDRHVWTPYYAHMKKVQFFDSQCTSAVHFSIFPY